MDVSETTSTRILSFSQPVQCTVSTNSTGIITGSVPNPKKYSWGSKIDQKSHESTAATDMEDRPPETHPAS